MQLVTKDLRSEHAAGDHAKKSIMGKEILFSRSSRLIDMGLSYVLVSWLYRPRIGPLAPPSAPFGSLGDGEAVKHLPVGRLAPSVQVVVGYL